MPLQQRRASEVAVLAIAQKDSSANYPLLELDLIIAQHVHRQDKRSGLCVAIRMSRSCLSSARISVNAN